MAEYDLGTAQGRIEIESDVDGVASTTAQLAALRAGIRSVDSPLSHLDDTMASAAQSAGGLAESLGGVADNLSAVASNVSGVAGDVSGLTGLTGLLDVALGKASEHAMDLAKAGAKVYGVLNAVRNPLGFIRTGLTTLGYNLFGINRELARFPAWTGTILKLSGAVSAVGIGALFMRRGIAGAGVAVFQLLSRSGTLAGVMGTVGAAFRTAHGNANLLGRTLRAVTGAVGGTDRGIRNFYNSLNSGLGGLSRMIVGAALMASGFRKLGTYVKFLPKIALGIGAIGLAAAALGPAASLVLGLADAIVQLSGAALILPGVLAIAGTAGVVLSVAMKGVSEAFKAAAGDEDKFEEAIKELSPGMQNVARTAQGFKKEFKDLKGEIQDTTFAGFSNDLKNLEANFFPILRGGSLQVAESLNGAKNALVDFLLRGDQMVDLQRLFSITSDTIRNFTPAIRPALTILKDTGIVGAEAFRDLTRGVGATTTKWSIFIAEARKTGQLREWIDEGVQGFRDLGSTIMDIGRGIHTVMEAFGGEGGDALEKMAAGAEKFAAAMEKSSNGGALEDIAKRLGALSDTSVDVVVIAVENLWKTMQNASKFAEALAASFGGSLATGLQVAGAAMQTVASALSQFEIVGSLIGTIAGFALAFKGLLIVLGPMIAGLKILMGLFMAMRGASAALVTMAAATARVSQVGGQMGRMAGTATNAMMGLAGALSGPVVAGITAAIAVAALWYSTQQQQNALHEQIQDDYKASGEAARAFSEEVMAANGKLSSAAMDEMTNSVSKLRQAWEGKGKDDNKWTDRVKNMTADVFNGKAFTNPFGGDEKGDAKDQQANRYDATVKALEDLKMTNADVSEMITSSGGTYEAFKQRLLGLGEGGATAVAELQPLREEFKNVTAAAERIGPASLAVSNGLKTIADEGASASDKLSALMTVLQALGLVQSDAEQAAFAYQEKLQKVAEEARSLVDPAQKMGDALLNGNKIMADAGPNAISLNNQLKSLADGFLANAAAGGDVNKAWADTIPQLIALGDQYGLTEQQILDVARSYGFVPEVVNTIMALNGGDQVAVDLNNILLQIQRLDGKSGSIKIETQEARDQVDALLRSVGGSITEWNQSTGEAKITVPPGTSDEVKAKIQQILDGAKMQVGPDGIKVPATVQPDPNAQQKIQDMMTPRAPIKIPVEADGGHNAGDVNRALANDKIGLRGNQAPPGTTPAPAGEIAPGVPAPPAEVKTSIKIEGAEEAKTQINQVALQMMNIKPVRVNFQVTGVVEALGALNSVVIALEYVSSKSGRANFMIAGTDAAIGALNAVVVALNNVPAQTVKNFMMDGTDAAIGAINAVKLTLDNLNPTIDSVRANFTGVGTAVQQAFAQAQRAIASFVSTALNPLAGLATQAQESGRALGQGFAQGILDKEDEVQAAAMRLAQAASRPLPRSPAEIGPFSGKGWTPYRGRTLAEGFAQGIDSGTATAEASSLNMAQAVSDAMDSVRAQFNMPQTAFSANRGIGDNSVKKYYRDIEQTDEELAEARAERAKQAAEQAKKTPISQGGLAPDPVAEMPKSGGPGSGDPNGDKLAAMSGFASQFGLQLTSGQRDEPGSFHNDGSAGDFSNGVQTDQMLAFANFIADTFPNITKELIYDDPRFNRQIDNGQFVGGGGGSSGFFAGSGDHSNHVHWAVDMAPTLGGAVKDGAQQGAQQGTQQGVAQAGTGEDTIPLVQNPDGTYSSPNAEWQKLIDRESGGDFKIVQQVQDANSGGNEASGGFQIAKGTWASNGGLDFAPTAGEATAEQQAIVAARIFNAQGGSPWGSGAGQGLGRENEELLRAGIARGGSVNSPMIVSDPALATAQSRTVDQLRQENKSIDEALRVASDPRSSDAQVIQSLQSIDGTMAGMSDTDKELLETQKSAIMEDRGIKEYDPYEGAIQPGEEFQFGLGAAQTALGIYKTLEDGLNNAANVGKLLIRGLSNTSDVSSLVDGVQGIASTISEVVSAVGSVVDIVASVAATAGSAIPGIGQVASVVSGITGGIANVNAVVDLIQEVSQIAGRFGGGLLASLAGGENGQLQGNVKTLLDFNDNTIKTWSDRNAAEKTVRGMPFQNSDPQNPNQAGGFRDLNIYQGPGTDPAEMMNQAMFAVAAHSSGVFSG